MTMANPSISNRLRRFFSFLHQVLRGLGQIMLQENALTGLLFLLGVFYGSITSGVAALVATTCGTIAAYLFQYDKAETEKGLYGFSAALVGVALTLFLKPGLFCWVLIIIGSVLASVIQHFFIKRNIPVFTLPFVLVTWLILFLSEHYFSGFMIEIPVAEVSSSDSVCFAIRGFGQVIFQGNLVSGALFFIAVFISSPIHALYGLAGGILSAILAFYFSVSIEDIGMGLLSYNAVLCAIVFAGTQIKDGIWVLVSVVLSLAISLLMGQYQLTQLTFPFVLASYLTQVLKNRID